MIRIAIVLICTCTLSSSLGAMVGGAPPASQDAGGAVIMLTGSHGTFCSGVAIARDLVLTAAHCVQPGADYKLISFDAQRQPLLKDTAQIARHPQFNLQTMQAHRATADVALIKLAAALSVTPVPLMEARPRVAAGERFVVHGYGLAVRREGTSGGRLRAATLIATGKPGNLQLRLIDPAAGSDRPGPGA